MDTDGGVDMVRDSDDCDTSGDSEALALSDEETEEDEKRKGKNSVENHDQVNEFINQLTGRYKTPNFSVIKVRPEDIAELNYFIDYYIDPDGFRGDEVTEINHLLASFAFNLKGLPKLSISRESEFVLPEGISDAQDISSIGSEVGRLYNGYASHISLNYLYFDEYLPAQKGKLYRKDENYFIKWEPFDGIECIDKICTADPLVDDIDAYCKFCGHYELGPENLEAATENKENTLLNSSDDAGFTADIISATEPFTLGDIDSASTATTPASKPLLVDGSFGDSVGEVDKVKTNWLCVGFNPLSNRDFKRLNQFIDQSNGSVDVTTVNKHCKYIPIVQKIIYCNNSIIFFS